MSLLRALATVSSMTLISRILGFVRDLVIARAFGAGLVTDAFFVAFRLPNLLRRLFAEGAFSQAFVPILAEYKNRRGEDDDPAAGGPCRRGSGAWRSSSSRWSACSLRRSIIYVTAPGFAATPGKFDLTVDLLRITFPYIFFISLTALAGGILNTYSRFSVPAITPALLNLSFIGFALWGAPYFDPPVTGAGLGGVRRRRRATGAAGSVPRAPRAAAALQAQLERRGRAARPAADGASGVRRLDRPGEPGDQRDICLVPRHRQCFLALLCRSPDGIPDWPARRCARHDTVAEPLEASRRALGAGNIRNCSTGGCD